MRTTAIRYTAYTACVFALLPLAAQAEESPARTALIEAFEANDCRMQLSDAQLAFKKAGVDPDLAAPTALAMFNEEAIKFEPDGQIAVLQIGSCEGSEVATVAIDHEVRAALVAFYEANDCVIDPKGDAIDTMKMAHPSDAVEKAIVSLANEGAITLAENESVLKIGAVCAGKAQ